MKTTTDNRRHEAPGKPELHMTRSEQAPGYQVEYLQPVADDDAVIAQAIAIVESRMKEPGAAVDKPDSAKACFFLELAEEPAEVFAVMFLDNRHRVISLKRMFYGTIDGASIHPREVVRAAINENAAAVILAHNHPSGLAEPSQADIRITKRLSEALALIDCQVLDHFVIGDKCTSCVSFAERGLI